MVRAVACLSMIALLAGCKGASSSTADGGPDAGPDAGAVSVTITASAVDTRFVTREAFLAAGEMQISGEPFAEAMGRDLANYSRDHIPADIYFDNSPNASGPWIDLAGFSTGVESYEYSKQPMNEAAFELAAGTSLVHGPLIDVTGDGGTSATAAMAAAMQHFAEGSNAEGRFAFPAGTYPVNSNAGNQNLLGTGTGAQNPLGWPGLWPTVHLFKSFDPTIHPTSDVSLGCAISSDDDPGGAGALGCADYECDATTMHLADRAAQIDPTITPGADGFSGWKYGLWVLNYLQVMHDAQENGVADLDGGGPLSQVGAVGNTVVGDDGSGNPTLPGTYLGSSDIEGFQAQVFISEMDNRAEDWLMHLSTKDGATLGGFSSIAEAQAYCFNSPLQWFPAEISVAETADGSGFPLPAYSLHSSSSELMDQLGLAMGYAEFYSLTDVNNVDVGGAQPARVMFDGDPFAAGSGRADGASNFQQRALAMLRVTMVNLDRLHTDPATGVMVDEVKMAGSTPIRGTTVATSSVAYTLLGIRTVLRSLSSQLELYSNNTTDTAIGSTPLDALPLAYPADPGQSFSQRLSAILQAHAQLLLNHLTDATGKAYSGWNVVTNGPIDSSDTLDAHTAAIRGLFAAYLATGDTRYFARAQAVYQRMDSVFYDKDARIYSPTPAPASTVVFTPLRFALLQSALRDMYELVAARPGGEALEPVLEERVARLNKLVLNGWDDRDQDRIVEWPDECVQTQLLPDGGVLPRGGLQMAERTLTGETGSLEEHLDAGQARTVTSDREHDCVPEVDDAQLPSALANSITFQIARSTP